MVALHWFDFFIIPGIAQGVFLSIVLMKVRNRNTSANRVLSIVLLLASVMLVGRLLWDRVSIIPWSGGVGLLIDATIFLFGPLILLYVKRLLYRGKQMINLSFYHFVPLTIYIGIITFILYFGPQELVTSYGKEFLIYLYYIIESFAIVINLVYCVIVYQLMKKYRMDYKQEISFEQSPILYLKYFELAVLVSLVAWAIGFVNVVFSIVENTFNPYLVVWVSIPVLIYIVGYYSLKQPELFRINIVPPVVHTSVVRLKPDEIDAFKIALERLMIEVKIYLKNDLTLSVLASELNTSANNVSWLLNEVYQKNFYDFVNRYRLQEFLKKVEKKEHLQKTLLALAMEVGFNSKSTFNKVFKTELSSTPSEYIKKLSDKRDELVFS